MLNAAGDFEDGVEPGFGRRAKPALPEPVADGLVRRAAVGEQVGRVERGVFVPAQNFADGVVDAEIGKVGARLLAVI